MIVSILQPYFFPYIGYFQLIAHCNVCVLFDDVQYIKNGWINRNRILSHGKAAWLTLPVLYGPHQLSIRRRRYQLDAASVRRCMRHIRAAYERAPHFDEVYPLLCEILQFPDPDVAAFNVHLIRRTTERLGITTRFVLASELDKNPELAGQELVIDICRQVHATRYINPISGIPLYRGSRFARDGIELGFLRSAVPTYPQFSQETVPALSIIDVLMFNSLQQIRELLRHYRIETGSDAIEAHATMGGAAEV